MASVPQVRELLRSFLSGGLDLQNFADQFDDLHSEISVAGDPRLVALGDEIAAYLGRVSAELVGEIELKQWLFPLSFDFPLVANTIQGLVPAFSFSVNEQVVGKVFQEQ